jgi:Zn-dependent protease/predicted transcriptional regulator
MMTGGLRIARIFGIPIYLHPTWFLVFLLVTFALAAEMATRFPDLGSGAQHAVAGATAILFFASILLHELGHSVLAQRHHVAVRSITLFVFGGVAMMEQDAGDARAEFEIAIAGPIVSAALALAMLLLLRAVPEQSTGHFMAGWLYRINLAVALFNLLPGFPLDGGRVLRAFLWARSGDAAKATRTAAGVGQAMAYGFILLGVLQALDPRWLGAGRADGIWLAFVGWFLLAAAGGALRQVEIDSSLAGLRARDIAAPVPARIAASSSVATFARELVMRGRRWALVEEPGRVVGLVTLSDVQRLDPDRWETTPVGDVATPRERMVIAAPDTPAREVLVAMGSKDVNQIPVVDSTGEVIGAVTRETLVHALELRRSMAG